MAAFVAPAKSPDKSIPLLKKIITDTLSYNDISFTYTIYPNPHNQKPKVKTQLIKLFGNRIQKGQNCLGITEDIVKDNIKNEEYNALIYVKNNDTDDSASGTLQYYDWCETGIKQLWISDLCRVKSPDSHSIISPIKALFDIIKNFYIEKGVTENYLMVDRGQPGIEKLLEIYSKYDFKIIDSCVLEDYIAMKKSLISNNNANNLEKNMKNLSLKSGGKNFGGKNFGGKNFGGKNLRRTQKKKKV